MCDTYTLIKWCLLPKIQRIRCKQVADKRYACISAQLVCCWHDDEAFNIRYQKYIRIGMFFTPKTLCRDLSSSLSCQTDRVIATIISPYQWSISQKYLENPHVTLSHALFKIIIHWTFVLLSLRNLFFKSSYNWHFCSFLIQIDL